MELTITQAARRYGRARSTVYRAIRDGRLTATTQRDGTARIDDAGLVQLWGPPGGGEIVSPHTPGASSLEREPSREVVALRQQVAALQAEIQALTDPGPPPSIMGALRRVLAYRLRRLAGRIDTHA